MTTSTMMKVPRRPMLHLFSDGRDTVPIAAENDLPAVEEALDAAGRRIATVCVRYSAMGRDQRWNRTECAVA